MTYLHNIVTKTRCSLSRMKSDIERAKALVKCEDVQILAMLIDLKIELKEMQICLTQFLRDISLLELKRKQTNHDFEPINPDHLPIKHDIPKATDDHASGDQSDRLSIHDKVFNFPIRMDTINLSNTLSIQRKAPGERCHSLVDDLGQSGSRYKETESTAANNNEGLIIQGGEVETTEVISDSDIDDPSQMISSSGDDTEGYEVDTVAENKDIQVTKYTRSKRKTKVNSYDSIQSELHDEQKLSLAELVEEANVSCEFCGSTFKTSQMLQNHNCETKSGKHRRTFDCVHCSIKCSSYLKWFRHQRFAHYPLKCEKCGDSIDGLRGYEKHYRRHKLQRTANGKFCHQCKKWYTISTKVHFSVLHGFVTKDPAHISMESKASEICSDQNYTKVVDKQRLKRCSTKTDVLSANSEVQNKQTRKHQKRLKTESKQSSTNALQALSVNKLNFRENGDVDQLNQNQALLCKRCNKSFKSEYCLIKHTRCCSQNKKFICKICEKGFTTRGNLNIHQAVHGERTYKCALCSKKYSSATRRNRHQSSHYRDKSLSCPQCDKRFSLKSGLQSHLYHMHNDDRKLFSCDSCGKVFRSISGYKEHRKTHVAQKTFICDACGHGFYDARSLKSHQRVHTGEKPFHCGTCGMSFAHRTTLRGHQRVHAGVKLSICNVCGKKFLDNARLAVHLKTHMSRVDQQQKCVECDKLYTNKACLKIHMTRMHKGVKPMNFVCQVCDRRFAQSSHLEAHVRSSHTGERPFNCSHCDKSFISKSELKKHSRRHTGEKPYKCDICSMSFPYSSSLNKHRLTHDKKPRENKGKGRTNKNLKDPSTSTEDIQGNEKLDAVQQISRSGMQNCDVSVETMSAVDNITDREIPGVPHSSQVPLPSNFLNVPTNYNPSNFVVYQPNFRHRLSMPMMANYVSPDKSDTSIMKVPSHCYVNSEIIPHVSIPTTVMCTPPNLVNDRIRPNPALFTQPFYQSF